MKLLLPAARARFGLFTDYQLLNHLHTQLTVYCRHLGILQAFCQGESARARLAGGVVLSASQELEADRGWPAPASQQIEAAV